MKKNRGGVGRTALGAVRTLTSPGPKRQLGGLEFIGFGRSGTPPRARGPAWAAGRKGWLAPPCPALPNLRALANSRARFWLPCASLSPFSECHLSPLALLSLREIQGHAMPSPVDPRVQPSRSGSSPEPRSPSPQRHSARPGTPRTPRRLESSFSIQAILAKPDPPAPAASPLSASACAASGLWTAPSLSPAPVLPWACPAPWLPASLSVGLCQRCLQPSALGLRMAHLCSLQGLGVPGTRCPNSRVQGSGWGG